MYIDVEIKGLIKVGMLKIISAESANPIYSFAEKHS